MLHVANFYIFMWLRRLVSRDRSTYADTSVCEKHIPFVPAFALQSCSINCSPAPDVVLWKLIVQHMFFSGGLFFHRHRYGSRSLCFACLQCVRTFGVVQAARTLLSARGVQDLLQQKAKKNRLSRAFGVGACNSRCPAHHLNPMPPCAPPQANFWHHFFDALAHLFPLPPQAHSWHHFLMPCPPQAHPATICSEKCVLTSPPCTDLP